MSTQTQLSRGHKKRERTHDQLIQAGLQVLADKGDALSISEVVARAQMSNGTFYNYFADRDELIDALARHSVVALAAETALQTAEQDPARRFAIATARFLRRAQGDRTWGRVVLRLTDHRRSPQREITRYLEEDLASGFEQGRFAVGPDEITLDLVFGLLTMAIRRIVDGNATTNYVPRVVERALGALGVPPEEATELANAAAISSVGPAAPRRRSS